LRFVASKFQNSAKRAKKLSTELKLGIKKTAKLYPDFRSVKKGSNKVHKKVASQTSGITPFSSLF
jgi:hypothetical protein